MAMPYPSCWIPLVAALAFAVATPAAAEAPLYGVTGDGAATSETLFELSTADATPSLFLALGAGDDGETIAFRPDDARLYHASGDTSPVFESIDLATKQVSGIARSGFEYFEALGLTWETGAGAFLLTNSTLELVRLMPSGFATKLADMDHSAKGLAFVGATLYTVSPAAPLLRVIDPNDGSTLSATTITLAGQTVTGANGLATHPETGELWALLKVAATPLDRQLVTLDPATGVASLVGATGDRFAGIAFGAPVSAVPAVTTGGRLVLAALLLASALILRPWRRPQRS
jgi:hypothetical protein